MNAIIFHSRINIYAVCFILISTFCGQTVILGNSTVNNSKKKHAKKILANTPPTSRNITISSDEDRDLQFVDTMFYYIDAERDPFTVLRIITTQGNGKLYFDSNGNNIINTGEEITNTFDVNIIELNKLKFRPNSNDNGLHYASFEFKVSDGTDFSIASYEATIDIAPVNDIPVVTPKFYTIDEDHTLTINTTNGLLHNATDIEGDALTVRISEDVLHGTLNANPDGSFQYTPEPNYYGVDTFYFQANDKREYSVVGEALITVNPVNDSPQPQNDIYPTQEDHELAVSAEMSVLKNDFDIENDVLQIELQNDVKHGKLILNTNDGKFIYTPDKNYFGTDNFTYRLHDGIAYSETFATVTITIEAINDIPIGENEHYTINEDELLQINAPGVLNNDTDVDDNQLQCFLKSNANSGTLELNTDGSFQYKPDANFFGADRFTYYISDGKAHSLPVTVTISIEALNDAPVATNDVYHILENENLRTTTVDGILSNDFDVENEPLSIETIADTKHGSLHVLTNGSFQYQPEYNYYGMDSFTYRLSDGAANSQIATARIHIKARIPQIKKHPEPQKRLCEGEAAHFEIMATSNAPITYQWRKNKIPIDDANDNILIINNISASDAANYDCVVSNIGGEVVSKLSDLIVQPIDVKIKKRDVLCENTHTGIIEVNASGGFGKLNYFLNGEQQSTPHFSNLIAATYSVTISDFTGCRVDRKITLTQPDSIWLTVDITDAKCYGDSGSIAFTVGGGTPPYYAIWTSRLKTQEIFGYNGLQGGTYQIDDAIGGVPASLYHLLVRDANACYDTALIVVNQPEKIEIELLEVKNTDCSNQKNGSVRVKASGGMLPYQFSLNNTDFQDHGSFTNLGKGIYEIGVTDLYNCRQSKQFKIKAETNTKADFSYFISNRSVHFINKSDDAYRYLWDFGDNTQSTTANPVHEYTTAGKYEVMLIATSSCTNDTIQKTLSVLSTKISETRERGQKPQIYPNPAANKNITISIPDCFHENHHVQIINKTGNIVFEHLQMQPTLEYNLTDLSCGIYCVLIRNRTTIYSTTIILL